MLNYAFNPLDDGQAGELLIAVKAARLAHAADEPSKARMFPRERNRGFSPYPRRF